MAVTDKLSRLQASMEQLRRGAERRRVVLEEGHSQVGDLDGSGVDLARVWGRSSLGLGQASQIPMTSSSSTELGHVLQFCFCFRFFRAPVLFLRLIGIYSLYNSMYMYVSCLRTSVALKNRLN